MGVTPWALSARQELGVLSKGRLWLVLPVPWSRPWERLPGPPSAVLPAPSDSGLSWCCRSPAGRPRVTRAFPGSIVPARGVPRASHIQGSTASLVKLSVLPHGRPGGGLRDVCPAAPGLPVCSVWHLPCGVWGLPTTKPHSLTLTVTAQCFFWKGFKVAVPNHCTSPRLGRRGSAGSVVYTGAGTPSGNGGLGEQLPRVGRHLCFPCLHLPPRGRVRSPVDGNVWNSGKREEKEDHV